MVEPEKTINTAWRADYALRDAQGEIALLLEAKCLGSNLEKYSTVQQLLSYAFGFGVLKVVVTDGIHWHFYSEFKPGNSTADAVNLLQDDVATCALRLIQWLDAAQSGHGLVKLLNSKQSELEEQHRESSRITTLKEKAEVQEKRILSLALTVKSQDKIFIELTDLQALASYAGQKPTQLRLPNGTMKPIAIWKDILLEACYLVLNTNAHLTLPLPDRAGKKRFLFSWAKPETGSSTQASYKGKTVFIGTHYSAADCISNALYVLQQLPVSHQLTTIAVSF
jgi:hypothetical protein